MKRLLVFSRNLVSTLGGAEISMRQALQKVEGDYDKIFVLGCCDDTTNGLYSKYQEITLPSQLKLLAFMPYIEYFFAKKKVSLQIKMLVEENDVNEIWCQNIWAPMAAKTSASVKVFLRDETAIGIRPIYFKGLKWFFSIIHRIIDYPFWCGYKRDLKFLYLNCSEVVTNSKWMASKFQLAYGLEATLLYPNIKIDELKQLYKDGARNNNSVVMIGGEYIKGLETFIDLAVVIPESNFIVFSKNAIDRKLPKNLEVKSWSADRSEPFRFAKVVLVPSVWNEAYGRVAAEAKALNIPVIVSDKGGLPEAVEYDDRCIAKNFDEFKFKLREVLKCAE